VTDEVDDRMSLRSLALFQMGGIDRIAMPFSML
jgi:hypothetical protein